VGRQQAIDEVAGLLNRPAVRLVTLTGPGGSARPAWRWPWPSGSATASVRALGVDLAGTDSPLQALVEQFGDERWLLVLDNLEQVREVAGDLEELLARCPGLAILATSRTVLGVRAEREYPVAPLLLPVDPTGVAVPALLASPAVALFVDRAGRCAPTSPSPRATPPRWWSCAGGWRGYRWRSSWPPRGPAC
jgi:hypothetical protein